MRIVFRRKRPIAKSPCPFAVVGLAGALLLYFPDAAISEAGWIVHQADERDGMTISVSAPPDWTAKQNGDQIILASPEEVFSEGARGSAVFLTYFFKINPQLDESIGATGDDAVVTRVEKGLASWDKHYGSPHRILEKGETTVDGEKAWWWIYTRKSDYTVCKSIATPVSRVELVTAFARSGFHVQLTGQACDRILLDRHLETLRKIATSARFGPLAPTVDLDGRSWALIETPLVRMLDYRDYVYDVALKGEIPPGWTQEIVSEANAGSGQEPGRLVVDFLPPSGTGKMRVWVQGLQVEPHTLDDYLTMTETGYVGKVLADFETTEPAAVDLPRFERIAGEKNDRWSGSGNIYVRSYVGNGRNMQRMQIDAYTFAAPNVVFSIFVMAREEEMPAFREMAAPVLRALRARTCQTLALGYGCSG